MIVIAVVQGKGGVGKTTLAINLAGEIVSFGRSVNVVDADPQASATQWAEPRRLHFSVRQHQIGLRNTLIWVRDVLKSGTDFTIIDTPSGFGPAFETAVLISDLAVIPCGPSSLDLNAAAKTVAKVRDVRRVDNGTSRCKIALIPTRVDLATEEGEQIRDELAELGEPVGPSLSYDIEFVRAFTTGQAVSSLPANASAAQDIKRVSHFLLRQVLPRATAPEAD